MTMNKQPNNLRVPTWYMGQGLYQSLFLKVLAVCDSVKWEIISNAGSTARLSFKLKTN